MQLKQTTVLKLVAAVLLCLLAACGGGSGSNDDSTAPSGPGNGGGNTDTTAPQISSQMPQQNATNVDPGNSIVITFSEAIDAANANTRLRVNGVDVATRFVISETTLTIQVENPANIEGAAVLTLIGIRDRAGNTMVPTDLVWTYRAIVRDTTAPSVVTLAPRDQAINVAASETISVQYSESIVGQNIAVDFRSGAGNATDPVIATQFAVDGDRLLVTPSFTGMPSGLVTLTVNGVRDAAGNQTPTLRWQWTYQTATPADTVAPTAVTREPLANATQVSASAVIAVRFNEAINVTNASATLQVNGLTMANNIVAQNDRAIIQVAVNNNMQGMATATLHGVRDAAGNVAADVTWSWTYATSTPTTGPLTSNKVSQAGVGGNGYLDYGCINDATRPSGWNTLFVNAAVSGGTGTRAQPFTRIAQAVSAAGSRTVICVASGQYSENLNLGSQRQRMLIGGLNSAFSARDPIATPSTISAAVNTVNVITAEAPTELVIDGFVITGSQLRGIEASAWDVNERITLRNNHIHHNGCQSVNNGTECGGVDLGGGGTVVIEVANNVIEENGGGHHGGGINIGGGTERLGSLDQTATNNDGFGDVTALVSVSANVHHNIIRNNRIYESSLPHGAGLAIGMNGDVHHNEFYGNDTVSDGDHYGVGGGLIGQHDRGGTVSIALLKVYNNWFEANRAGKHGSAMFFDQLTVGYAYNNVIVKNIGTGAILVDGSCSDTCQGPNGNHGRNFATIVNNTIADNEGAGLAVQDSTAHIYYNVFWKNRQTGGDIYLSNGSPGADNIVRGAYNIINTNLSSFPLLSNSASAESDAGFLQSLTEQNYHISNINGSLHPFLSTQNFTPAIVIPTPLIAPMDDYSGTLRPDGSGRFVFGALQQ